MSESLSAAIIYPHPEARSLDPTKVAALADSIREVGLLNPIIVRSAKKYRNGVKADAWEIIAGHHRYEACAKVLRWEEIPCQIRDSDDLLAELVMIDENLCRANLTPAQEAYQVSRRKEVYEALHPETSHGGNGSSGKFCHTNTASFVADTSRQTGKAERTLRLDASRGEALGQDLKRVAGTSLDKGVELDALAKLPSTEREDLVARAEKGERVTARVRQVKIADEPLNDFEATQKQVSALVSAWDKAGPEAREQFLARIDRPVMDRRYA